MRLFKSQWLQEQHRHVAGSYREPAFGCRYGRRAASFLPDLRIASNDDDGDVSRRKRTSCA
ncbi:hypothetical protein [Lysobacter sp. CFH 32150]|uniref:hypothetical protein n=1 Tax=Lysobacter sp. CFH 32150 TaxID=2927128 RepID=UPI001FA703E2|nr:hypothetical protein [Lysobacter sp. CFH 32150]MCI4567969.1 hypothetical protein [Lysobacter sp. CFH 32150]